MVAPHHLCCHAYGVRLAEHRVRCGNGDFEHGRCMQQVTKIDDSGHARVVSQAVHYDVGIVGIVMHRAAAEIGKPGQRMGLVTAQHPFHKAPLGASHHMGHVLPQGTDAAKIPEVLAPHIGVLEAHETPIQSPQKSAQAAEQLAGLRAHVGKHASVHVGCHPDLMPFDRRGKGSIRGTNGPLVARAVCYCLQMKHSALLQVDRRGIHCGIGNLEHVPGVAAMEQEILVEMAGQGLRPGLQSEMRICEPNGVLSGEPRRSVGEIHLRVYSLLCDSKIGRRRHECTRRQRCGQFCQACAQATDIALGLKGE